MRSWVMWTFYWIMLVSWSVRSKSSNFSLGHSSFMTHLSHKSKRKFHFYLKNIPGIFSNLLNALENCYRHLGSFFDISSHLFALIFINIFFILKGICRYSEHQIIKRLSSMHVWVSFILRTAEGFEMQIGTNHFGHFYLTNLLLPLLREASISWKSRSVYNLMIISFLTLHKLYPIFTSSMFSSKI